MKELIIGCGSRHNKFLCLNDNSKFVNPVRLDINKDHKPDIVHDLRVHPLPFNDNEFDEIHAYEVLEHLAIQGDYKFFFREFSEYWRILKDGGIFFATVPSHKSRWALGDPSHKRIIMPENLVFLSQEEYSTQVGKTSMSDFRNIYSADFRVIHAKDNQESFEFALKAIK